MSKPIPFDVLERFARELGLTQAILVGWAPSTGTTHVVTWGDSLTDSAQAAHGGNAVKRAIGFPEPLCCDVSPRVAEALAAPEEWICIPCGDRNVTRADQDRCCLCCGMDLHERGALLRFLLQGEPLITHTACGGCAECAGAPHHWLTSIPDLSPMASGGDPFIPCKHCEARADICCVCCEGAVWPRGTSERRCAACIAEGA